MRVVHTVGCSPGPVEMAGKNPVTVLTFIEAESMLVSCIMVNYLSFLLLFIDRRLAVSTSQLTNKKSKKLGMQGELFNPSYFGKSGKFHGKLGQAL